MERIDIAISKESSTILNNLLKKLTTKQIKLPEYLMECAYWFMTDTFNTISWKPNPTKPAEVREFERLDYKQKDRLSDNYYEEKWQIGQYYESLNKVRSTNVGNLEAMELVHENIPEGDTVNRGKLKEKIDFYNGRIEWHRNEEWMRRR